MPSTLGIVDSTWTPLTFAPSLWLDAAETSTITESGGSVSQWDDKSGNGLHVSQANAAFQPTTGAVSQNGLNVLEFSTDNLRSAKITQPLPITMFIVAATQDLSSSNRQAIANRGITPTIFQVNQRWSFYNGSVVSGSTPIDNNYHVLSALFDGANSELRLDGALEASANPGSNFYDDQIILIGSDFNVNFDWDGYIAEIIMYFYAMSITQQQRVENYLLDKWGL